MDEATKAYFENMVEKIDGVSREVKSIKEDHKKTNDKVNHIENMLTKHIAYNKGLDVKERLTKAEDDIEKKASKAGLQWSLALFFVILTAAISAVAAFK